MIFFLVWKRTVLPLGSSMSSASVRPRRASVTSQSSLPFSGVTLYDLVEEPEDVLVGAVAQGPEKDRGQELLLPVEADVEVVLGVVLELDPGAPIGDDLGDEVALDLALPEEHAGRALELADDDPLDPVEDERPLLGHEGDVAEIDLLLLDVLQPLGFRRRVLFPRDEPDLEPERDGVGVALLEAFVRAVLHLQPDPVAAVVAQRHLDLPGGVAVGADFLLRELGVGREKGAAAVALRPGVLDALQPAALAFPVADGSS